MTSAATTATREALLGWFDEHARDLPWRGPAATPWSVMVSEFMLQQTPVARVLPVHEQWLERWPTPEDLAAEPAGEAVRMWGRLGYPRRALRLHAAATAIVERHGGEVPEEYDDLRALPGIGDYTASAIATFAFGRRHAVLDTNVRRVLARAFGGSEHPPPSVTAAERTLASIDGEIRRMFRIGSSELLGGSIHRMHSDPERVERILRDPRSYPHHARLRFLYRHPCEGAARLNIDNQRGRLEVAGARPVNARHMFAGFDDKAFRIAERARQRRDYITRSGFLC